MAKAVEALLVCDMLNDFLLEGAPLEVPEARRILPAVRDRIESARVEGRHVVYVCDAHAPDDKEFERMGWSPHAVRGTAGAKVVEALEPGKNDIVIPKTTYSGFFGTDLDRTLKSLGVERLDVTGCVTNICILYTVADAVLRGYRVRVFEDSVAGLSQEDHRFAIGQMKNVLGIEIV